MFGKTSRQAQLFVAAMAAILMFMMAKSLAQSWDAILQSNYPNTDDALRLAQIRDWMAGQSWFDTRQMRISPPQGGDIHWSRLVDVPIAAFLWLLTPLFGPELAEKIVLASYPLLIFSSLIILITITFRRHFGAGVAVFSAALAPLSLAIAMQYAPMRIDHHSVQILLAAISLTLALRPASLRQASGMGCVLALYLSISFEALPYVVLFGLLWVWRVWKNPVKASWANMAAYAASFTLASALFLTVTRGFSAVSASYCDAMSLPWLAAAAAVSAILCMAASLRHPPARALTILTVLAIAAGIAILAITLINPACLAGPFAKIDPLVRDHWLNNVLEGRPVWDQSPDIWVHVWAPIVIGLAGTIFALRYGPETQKSGWQDLLLLLIGAVLVSLQVLRGGGVAQLFALPGIAWLILTLWGRARQIEKPTLRIIATLGAAALAPPIFVGPLAAAITPAETAEAVRLGENNQRCMAHSAIAPLAQIAHTTLFTPIDLGAQVIEATPHNVIATPHHRNQKQIGTVISAFLAKPDDAYGIIKRSGAQHLIICKGANEMRNYRKKAPTGLAAQLERGTIPDWLEPVQLSGKTPILLYRIK
jgi:hypothetical protein